MVASSKTRFASAVKLAAACPFASVTMPLYVVHTVPSTVDSSTRKLDTTRPHSVRSVSWFSPHICAAAGALTMGTAPAAMFAVEAATEDVAEAAALDDEGVVGVAGTGDSVEALAASMVVSAVEGNAEDSGTGMRGSLMAKVLLAGVSEYDAKVVAEA